MVAYFAEEQANDHRYTQSAGGLARRGCEYVGPRCTTHACIYASLHETYFLSLRGILDPGPQVMGPLRNVCYVCYVS